MANGKNGNGMKGGNGRGNGLLVEEGGGLYDLMTLPFSLSGVACNGLLC